jgi:hypothetical protein
MNFKELLLIPSIIKRKINMEQSENTQQSQTKIQVNKGGPYLVKGTVLIVNKDGTETQKEGSFALCRCGGSKNKPYCDGSHKEIEFDK